MIKRSGVGFLFPHNSSPPLLCLSAILLRGGPCWGPKHTKDKRDNCEVSLPALGQTQPLLFDCPKFWPSLLGLDAVSHSGALSAVWGSLWCHRHPCGNNAGPPSPVPEHSSQSRPEFPQDLSCRGKAWHLQGPKMVTCL